MKKVLLFTLTIVCCQVLYSQSGQWTWMKGDSTANVTAVYGTQGIPNATNKPPGIYEPCEWLDHQGNLWLYGGSNGTAFANLWKFDPLTNEWTWMQGPGNGNTLPVYGTQGVSSPLNTPGSRAWGVGSWVDTAGNFWLFGGSNSGNYNDLWKYDPSTNEWTWMKGLNGTAGNATYGTQGVADPSNTPGARRECAATWVDSLNRLWIFGGEGKTNSGNGLLNDLWRYDIATNEWTWVRGANTINPAGNYGTITVSNPGNDPPGRNAFGRWIDHQGNFWLFGGGSYSTGYAYNDLWRYNLQTNEWTWMNGTNQTDDSGVYGSYCIQFDSTYPNARFENRFIWSDLSRCSMWLFGGRFMGTQYSLSDFWHFDAAANKFTLVGGNSATNTAGFYGTQMVYDPANYPGGRGGGLSWTDLNGNLWMYGGWSPGVGYLNDLWKCQLDGTCPVVSYCASAPISNFSCSDTLICESDCVDFTSLSFNNPTSWLWSFPGGNPSTSSQQNPVSICYAAPGTYDVTLVTSNALGADTLTLAGYIIVNASPVPPVITQNNDTLTSSPANTYQWYYTGIVIPGATNQQVIITQSGEYSVVITNSSGCTATDTILTVFMLPQSNFSSDQIGGCPGSCFDFTNNSLNATTFQWSFPGGNPSSSSQQNPNDICYSNPGSYDVTLIASSIYASDTLTVPGYITIFTPLLISISQSGNLLTCNPAALTYQWYLNAIAIPAATNQTLYINQVGDYSVTITDTNECTSSAFINVQNVPSPAFSSPDTLLCEKFCINFTDQSTNNPTAWQWIFPGGIPTSSNDENPANICYNIPGIYDVTLITTNAFGNDTLTQYNYITVYPTPPFPIITQVGYLLTSSSANSYQWQFNSYDIPGATNQSYTVLQTGYYTVIVGDSNGCVNSATQYVLISGVDDVNGDANISIYPNPSSGNFIVELLNGFMGDEVSIEVLNALGQSVYSCQEKNSSSHWKKEIDLGKSSSGVYFLKIKTTSKILNYKMIISR